MCPSMQARGGVQAAAEPRPALDEAARGQPERGASPRATHAVGRVWKAGEKADLGCKNTF